MKILHVIQGLPKAAGTTTFVQNLVNELSKSGNEVSIQTAAGDIKHCHVPMFDIVHIHGLWSPFLHRFSVQANRGKVPVVWSTHGMTAPWSMRHKRWKKLIAWCMYQKRDLKDAALVHATSDMEFGWNSRLGLTKGVVVPLGTNLVNGAENQALCQRKTLLFVGRIYPVKALDRLIQAFQITPHAGWQLRIVGPDQGGYLQKLLEMAGPDVEFPGPRYGADLEHEYANCDCLALVSHTENFGATVVDALAHGKPVITGTNTPWSVVGGGHGVPRCGWWVENSVESIATAIKEMIQLSDAERHDMGRCGRDLVESRYSWKVVAERMLEAYGQVRGHPIEEDL